MLYTQMINAHITVDVLTEELVTELQTLSPDIEIHPIHDELHIQCPLDLVDVVKEVIQCKIPRKNI